MNINPNERKTNRKKSLFLHTAALHKYGACSQSMWHIKDLTIEMGPFRSPFPLFLPSRLFPLSRKRKGIFICSSFWYGRENRKCPFTIYTKLSTNGFGKPDLNNLRSPPQPQLHTPHFLPHPSSIIQQHKHVCVCVYEWQPVSFSYVCVCVRSWKSSLNLIPPHLLSSTHTNSIALRHTPLQSPVSEHSTRQRFVGACKGSRRGFAGGVRDGSIFACSVQKHKERGCLKKDHQQSRRVKIKQTL